MYKIYANEIVEKIKLDLEAKNAKADIKSKDKKIYKIIISKEVEDRDNEVILLNGLDIKWYKKNPVVLIDHSYKVEDIVGKTIKIYTEGNKMYADFVFANTEKAKILEEMYENGFINAASIGFMVKGREKENWKRVASSELLEWSLVVAGSCREALKEKNIDLYEKATKSGVLGKIKTIDTIQKEVKEVNELDDIKKDLKEIKTILKNLADDKVKEKQAMEKEEAELKAKKELLQSINKGISNSLEKIKLLK